MKFLGLTIVVFFFCGCAVEALDIESLDTDTESDFLQACEDVEPTKCDTYFNCENELDECYSFEVECVSNLEKNSNQIKDLRSLIERLELENEEMKHMLEVEKQSFQGCKNELKEWLIGKDAWMWEPGSACGLEFL